MPVLLPSNPAISIIGQFFESTLPPSTFENNNFVPLFRALSSPDTFGQEHITNGALLAGSLGRALATTIGWESARIPNLAHLSDTVKTPFSPDVDAAIDAMFAQLLKELQPTITAALDPLVDAIADAISGVPIVGWIAQVGFMTWKVVQSALSYEWPVHLTNIVSVGYDKPNDEHAANRMLLIAGTPDWGDIFDPPDGDFSQQAMAATSGGPVNGWQWGQLGPTKANPNADPGSDTKLGAMPGIGGFAGFWQTPLNKPGATKNKKDYDYKKKWWAGPEQIISQGQLFPSATALAGQLWANMQLPTPALGRIDFVGLRNRWVDYGNRLVAFSDRIRDRFSRGDWSTNQVRYGWNWYHPSATGTQLVGYGSPGDVPKQYRSWELDNLIRYKIDKAWVKAVQSLQSHAGAYVSDDAPLIRNDPSLKMLLTAVKRDLIEGRLDVLRVDPTLVPDPQYRKAIEATQAKLKAIVYLPGGGLPSGPQRTPTPGSADAPDLPALPGAISGIIPNGFDIRHLAGIAVAGLGIGAATYYFDDDLRRIISGMRARARR